MHLRELIDVGQVHLGAEVRDPVEVLTCAAEQIEEYSGMPTDTVVRSLLEREQLGSTSVGHGFAIPHCKIDGLKELALVLIRVAEPLDFGASDDQPVSFFFVVVSPPDKPADHLKLLSQIARILKRTELREGLLGASDADQVVDAIRAASEAEGL
jgi:PTS system nitrogen regulatory IIA component